MARLTPGGIGSFTPSGTQDVNLTKVGGSSLTLGQTTMSASIPVVLASNQASIPVAATLGAETTKVIGTTRITGNIGGVMDAVVGAAVPANTIYVGVKGGSSLLQPLNTAGVGATGVGSDGVLAIANFINNGSSFDRQRSVITGTDSTGTGIAAAGLLAQFDDVAPTAITENQFGNLRMSANRNFYTTLRDAAGNERGLNVASTGNISVDTVTTITTVSTLTGGGIASGSADSGNPVKVGAKYNSSKPTFADGQRGDLQLSADGSLTNAPDSTTEAAADGVSNTLRVYKDVFAFTPTQKVANWVFNGTTWDRQRGDTNHIYAGGNIAHDGIDSGNPVKVGMIAYSPDGTTPGTAVAELDRTNAKGDLDGRLFINDEHPRSWSYHEDSSSALTDASVAADPGDGFQIVITEIFFSTGAATACNIFFEEGATKILGPWYLEAVAGRGLFWKGKKHVTASTALTVTTSAAIAHGLDIQGYIQAV